MALRLGDLLRTRWMRPLVLSGSLVALGAAWVQPVQSQAKAAKPTFEKNAQPLFNKYCLPCHTGKEGSGGVSLDEKTTAALGGSLGKWERAVRNIKSGAMPPKGMPQPTAAEKKAMIEVTESALAAACNLNDPGRVVLRRLNRTEYNNAVRDLTGVDFKPGEDFPLDDVGYGFDNIGDVLTISPLLMEKYLDAAVTVAEKAVVIPKDDRVVLDVGKAKITGAGAPQGPGILFHSNGELSSSFTPKIVGMHKVTVTAGASKSGDELAKMEVLVAGQRLGIVDVKTEIGKPEGYTFPVRLDRTPQEIKVRFLNDHFVANVSDRNLMITGIMVEPPKPLGGGIPDSHKMIVGEPPVEGKELETARARLASFARRAFRRPATPEEMDRLMSVVKQVQANREPYEAWLQVGVAAILTSPTFLFKAEIDPAGKAGARKLSGYELASRLSFFLWSSIPDEQLLTLAGQGQLSNPTVLSAQVKRMLADPKAIALAENFGGQWLELRKLQTAAPDKQMFPGFNEKIREAMVQETTLFFNDVVKNDRPVLSFLDGKFTYVNEDLARFYGMEGVTGPEMRKVAVTDPNRSGVLTHASILTLTSNPTRTSPVKRGKWILEQILGTPPPPAPPGASQLSEAREKIVGKTLRQRMEMHRKDPNCATCHQRMDPLGFGLENFDAVGKWRKQEEGAPVDASGVLPGGEKFVGPAQMRDVLLAKKPQFVESLAEKLLIYATGRGLTPNDRCFVEEVARRCTSNQYKMSSMIVGVVLSEPFVSRTIGGKTAAPAGAGKKTQ